tara:strand:+ start:2213 stop:3211 length:999 start_codon:yes stop_codon:yes gene_type:complete
MAIYKLFSEKDTFISKHRSTQNFGRDEILEISNETILNSINADVNRTLIQFETAQIYSLINFISGSFTTSLRLFLANATIPSDYTIFSYPISQSWDMGLGKSADNPTTTGGVTWDTAPTYTTEYSGSQSFLYSDDKDINIDVTSIIGQWNSGSIDNNGLILKLSSSIEDSSTPLITKFFSMDTHTIYPPHLEFKWDDSSYSTTLSEITSSNFSTSITNNRSEFLENSTYKFRIKSRDTYPSRAFSTSSVYTNAKSLPSTSYWALKDAKTEEMVIDFDTNYTKISCDDDSNYFKLYINGLQPERYYQILYKILLSNGEVIIIDNKSNYFKVVR